MDGFWIDRCEVTNYQYLLYLVGLLRKSTSRENFTTGITRRTGWTTQAPDGGRTEPGGLRFLVCRAVLLQCLGKRLPSEAEWGKVVRDQTEGAYPFEGGAEFLPDYGWFRKIREVDAHCRGKTPNSYGYTTRWGMHGNGSLTVSALSLQQDNPQGPKTGAYRVLRGGAWNDPADYLRPACVGTTSSEHPF